MEVERAINVGFHSYFGTLKRSRHSKTHKRLAITDGFPFNPTYDSCQCAHYKYNLTDQATG